MMSAPTYCPCGPVRRRLYRVTDRVGATEERVLCADCAQDERIDGSEVEPLGVDPGSVAPD